MGRLPTALSPSVAAAGNQTKQVSRRSQFVVPFLPDHSSSSCRPTLPLVGMPVAIWAASRLTVNSLAAESAFGFGDLHAFPGAHPNCV